MFLYNDRYCAKPNNFDIARIALSACLEQLADRNHRAEPLSPGERIAVGLLVKKCREFAEFEDELFVSEGLKI